MKHTNPDNDQDPSPFEHRVECPDCEKLVEPDEACIFCPVIGMLEPLTLEQTEFARGWLNGK